MGLNFNAIGTAAGGFLSGWDQAKKNQQAREAAELAVQQQKTDRKGRGLLGDYLSQAPGQGRNAPGPGGGGSPMGGFGDRNAGQPSASAGDPGSAFAPGGYRPQRDPTVSRSTGEAPPAPAAGDPNVISLDGPAGGGSPSPGGQPGGSPVSSNAGGSTGGGDTPASMQDYLSLFKRESPEAIGARLRAFRPDADGEAIQYAVKELYKMTAGSWHEQALAASMLRSVWGDQTKKDVAGMNVAGRQGVADTQIQGRKDVAGMKEGGLNTRQERGIGAAADRQERGIGAAADRQERGIGAASDRQQTSLKARAARQQAADLMRSSNAQVRARVNLLMSRRRAVIDQTQAGVKTEDQAKQLDAIDAEITKLWQEQSQGGAAQQTDD